MPAVETNLTLWCCAKCQWAGTSDEAIDHALREGHTDIRKTTSAEAVQRVPKG